MTVSKLFWESAGLARRAGLGSRIEKSRRIDNDRILNGGLLRSYKQNAISRVIASDKK